MTRPLPQLVAVLVDANVLYSWVLRDFLLYSADAELENADRIRDAAARAGGSMTLSTRVTSSRSTWSAAI